MKRIGYIGGERIVQRGDWERFLHDVVYEKDDFLGDILKDEWGIFVSAGCTGALVAALNGNLVLTTVVTVDFFSQVSSQLNFNAVHAAGMEARVCLDVLANSHIEVGFGDALTQANGTNFDDFGIGAAVPTPVAADSAAVVGFDPTISAPNHTHLQAANIIGGVAPAAVDMGVDPVAGTFIRLGVQLDALGNAYYYVDGALLGTQLLAVTPATALTPFVAVRNKAGAPAVFNLTVDYIKFWQNR